jgi:hypothetical protein
MADDAFYSPTYRPPQIQPRVGDHLWSLRKAGRQVDCRLLIHGEYGVEVQLLRNGEFYAGRRFLTRELAVSFAERERGILERKGWG